MPSPARTSIAQLENEKSEVPSIGPLDSYNLPAKESPAAWLVGLDAGGTGEASRAGPALPEYCLRKTSSALRNR